MKILVTGSTGFIGSKLLVSLAGQGHDVHRLVRTAPQRPNEIPWNPAAGIIDTERLEGFDAVIHLAGENLGVRRWTTAQKRRIRDSRVEGTALLARALASLNHPPKVLVSASAVGFYGDRGEERLSEGSTGGRGFMAELCRDWEAACAPAEEKGIRVVFLRMGVILSSEYGALAALLPAHRLGVGPVMASGEQFMPWVSVSDVLRAVDWLLQRDDVRGPVNVVAPEQVRQRTFAQTLSRLVGRKVRLRVPGAMLRLARGQVVDPLLLDSNRVSPQRLLEAGFGFAQPTLELTLQATLPAEALAGGEARPTQLLPMR